MNLIFDAKYQKEFAKRLKKVRTDIAGVSQDAFAHTLYVSRAYINRLENARVTTEPDSDFLHRICNTYDVSFDWLISGTGPFINPSPLTCAEEEESIVEHYEKPDFQLFYADYMHNQYQAELEYTLLEILKPEDLSECQYAKLIDTFVTLTHPFLDFMETVRQDFLENGKVSREQYKKYLQELNAIRDAFYD